LLIAPDRHVVLAIERWVAVWRDQVGQ